MCYCIFYYATIGKRRNGQLIINCPHIFIFFLVFWNYIDIYICKKSKINES